MKLILLFLSALTTAAFAQNVADRAIATTRSAAVRSQAQMSGSMLTKDMENRQAPELFRGEIEDVGPQFLIARPQGAAPAHHWIEAYADAQFFYTTNALLTEKANRETGVMVLTAQAAITPPPFSLMGGQVSTKAGYRHQWWLYSLDKTANQLNNFDFAVSTVFLSARHSWDEKWVASLGLDYNRYLSHEDGWNEFYVELTPSWSIERNLQIGNGQLTVGYYGAYHWTQTDPMPVQHINDRLDSTLGLFYSQELLPHLVVQPYYRFQWSHYTENSDRNDFYNTVGLALIYSFNDWASLRTFVSYENRNSTDDTVADYNKWDSGAGVTFSARF